VIPHSIRVPQSTGRQVYYGAVPIQPQTLRGLCTKVRGTKFNVIAATVFTKCALLPRLNCLDYQTDRVRPARFAAPTSSVPPCKPPCKIPRPLAATLGPHPQHAVFTTPAPLPAAARARAGAPGRRHQPGAEPGLLRLLQRRPGAAAWRRHLLRPLWVSVEGGLDWGIDAAGLAWESEAAALCAALRGEQQLPVRWSAVRQRTLPPKRSLPQPNPVKQALLQALPRQRCACLAWEGARWEVRPLSGACVVGRGAGWGGHVGGLCRPGWMGEPGAGRGVESLGLALGLAASDDRIGSTDCTTPCQAPSLIQHTTQQTHHSTWPMHVRASWLPAQLPGCSRRWGCLRVTGWGSVRSTAPSGCWQCRCACCVHAVRVLCVCCVCTVRYARVLFTASLLNPFILHNLWPHATTCNHMQPLATTGLQPHGLRLCPPLWYTGRWGGELHCQTCRGALS